MINPGLKHTDRPKKKRLIGLPRVIWIMAFVILYGVSGEAQTRYRATDGIIRFRSDAPLEIIEAESVAMKGIIDVDERAFAFSVAIESFQGFNSPLQREHFNENYLESRKYPRASFTGKIIEQVDLRRDGDYDVRAKGKLHIHGVEQERIIKGNISIRNGKMTLKSDFSVLLEEHDIAIPKIVYQKIAKEIRVNLEASFEKE